MALDKTKLFRIGGGVPGLYIYTGEDAASTANLFDTLADQLEVGDVILGTLDNAAATINLVTVVNRATQAVTVVAGV